MRVHWRPPLPPAPPPPKPPPIAAQLQAEELTKAAQTQQARLKKLYGARKRRGDADEDDAERDEKSSPDRRLDFYA